MEPPPLFVADLGDATLGDGGQGAAGRDGAALRGWIGGGTVSLVRMQKDEGTGAGGK